MIDKIFSINQILSSILGFFIITILLYYWNKFIIKEWDKFSADEKEKNFKNIIINTLTCLFLYHIIRICIL